MEEKTIFTINDIMKILPHRYPFLMVDKIIEFENNKRIVAIKNVTNNEPFFTGHFPERPVMPGVMILEAMAQAACVLAYKSTEGVPQDKYVFLVGADGVKWKRQVLPGDTLRIEMSFAKARRPLWFLEGNVTVDGKLVASATISAAEVE